MRESHAQCVRLESYDWIWLLAFPILNQDSLLCKEIMVLLSRITLCKDSDNNVKNSQEEDLAMLSFKKSAASY